MDTKRTRERHGESDAFTRLAEAHSFNYLINGIIRTCGEYLDPERPYIANVKDCTAAIINAATGRDNRPANAIRCALEGIYENRGTDAQDQKTIGVAVTKSYVKGLLNLLETISAASPVSVAQYVKLRYTDTDTNPQVSEAAERLLGYGNTIIGWHVYELYDSDSEHLAADIARAAGLPADQVTVEIIDDRDIESGPCSG